jgi:hypothetical protein
VRFLGHTLPLFSLAKITTDQTIESVKTLHAGWHKKCTGFLTGTILTAWSPTANLKSSVADGLLGHLEFVVPEKLVPLVLQPH